MATTSTDDGGGRPLFEEWPYAYVIKTSHMQSPYAPYYCHFCLKGTADEDQHVPERVMQRCSRCSFARYCDRKCQLAAFKDHKEECKLLAKANGFVPDTTTRLIVRIIFRRGDDYQPDGRLPHQLHQRRFQDLMNHAEDIMKDPVRSKQFESCRSALVTFLGSEKCPPTNDLLDMFGKVMINAYGINIDGLDLAYGLYVGASALDHSCNPDATYTFDGPKITIHPLKTGLRTKSPYNTFINYCEILAFTSDRRESLAAKYYFTCQCEYCLDTLRDKEMKSVRCSHCSSGIALLDDSEKTAICQTCQKSTDTTDAVALMAEIKSFLGEVREPEDTNSRIGNLSNLNDRTRQLLSDINVYGWHMNVQLQNLWVDVGRNDEASICCERSLIVRRRFLNPNDELLLSQLTNAANFMMRDPSRVNDCIQLLTEAQKGYSFTFGSDHGPAQECRRLLDIVRNKSAYKKWLAKQL